MTGILNLLIVMILGTIMKCQCCQSYWFKRANISTQDEWFTGTFLPFSQGQVRVCPTKKAVLCTLLLIGF